MDLNPGERLRLWRQRAKLSLSEAAPLFGCKGQTLSRIERGDRSPPLEVAAKIAERAEIPMNAWVTDTGPRPVEPTGDDSDAQDGTTSR